MPDLSAKEKEDVRLGTLLAIRAASAADILSNCRDGSGAAWVFETPARREGVANVFKLDETMAMDDLKNVKTERLPVLPLGLDI